MAPSNPSDEEIIRSIAHELPVGVWVARAPGGEFVYANRKFQEIMGMAGRADVKVGEYAQPYGIHDRAGALYPEAKLPFVRALAEQREVVVDDIVIHRPDGGRAFIRATARPIADEKGTITHVEIAFIDISREVKAEAAREELAQRSRQAERLESIGTLASGIAHDFNNLLAVVKLLVEKTRSKEKDPDKLRDLETIDQMTDSAVSLTRGLLSFAGRSSRTAAPVEPSKTVERLADVIRRSLDRSIEVTIATDARQALLADESSLEQVVMNLAINARDSMPDGGSLEIRTRDDGARVILEVSDTGHGIPPEIRGRIFEPYFSTRPHGHSSGTGLGLATVHGIVQLYHGTIEVLDRPSKGTTMRLSFPAIPAPAPRPVPEAPKGPWKGTGLLLVVDDQDLVRRSISAQLRSLGFEVIEADSGPRAVELYRARRSEFRGVLLDLTMPKMDGETTFKALRELDPDVRVLLTTGYALESRVDALLKQGVRGFIAKPYGLDALAKALTPVLRDP